MQLKNQAKVGSGSLHRLQYCFKVCKSDERFIYNKVRSQNLIIVSWS